jgi:prepilin-type N-terminal cleavage/methylation domain-containing protein
MNQYLKNNKAFTLIELLIVIVIIGILAGVLIAVIDPGAQQNRAKDANLVATLNKVSLVTESHISSYGRTPSYAQFMGNLRSTAESIGDLPCATTSASSSGCSFDVIGNTAPSTCGVNSTDKCYYYYTSDASESFRIMVKSYGLSDSNFIYDNSLGGVYMCNTSLSYVTATDSTIDSDCEKY